MILGQIIYYGDDEGLRDFVVLNPEWLTKAISYVLRDDPTRHSGGVLDHARLREIWQDRPDGTGYPAHYHRVLPAPDGEIRHLLPAGTTSSEAWSPSSCPTSGRTCHGTPAHRCLAGCAVWPWSASSASLHPGLMAWLTVRHHRASTGRHWRTGVFLRHPIAAYDSEALLELLPPLSWPSRSVPPPRTLLPRAVATASRHSSRAAGPA